MDNSLKLALGIVLGALAIGLVGYQASAVNGSGFGGMMGGMMGFGNHYSRGFGMMGAFANGTVNGTFDMNAMHKAMHGEDADVDMNQMHARMLAENLTQEDFKEMKEHCPMMG